jgi:hypothetical protein
MVFSDVIDPDREKRDVAQLGVLDLQRRGDLQILSERDGAAVRSITGEEKIPDTVPPASMVSQAIELIGDTAEKSSWQWRIV